jgi:hypothetical protein
MICEKTRLLYRIVFLVLALVGCSATPPSSPPHSLSDLYGTYESQLVAGLRDRIPASGEIKVASPADRNEIINGLLLLIDRNYDRIERSLYGT